MASVEPTVVAQIPAANIAVLDQQGAFTLPWRRYFQQIGGSTGSSATIAAIIAQLDAVAVQVALAVTTAEAALAAAQAPYPGFRPFPNLGAFIAAYPVPVAGMAYYDQSLGYAVMYSAAGTWDGVANTNQ